MCSMQVDEPVAVEAISGGISPERIKMEEKTNPCEKLIAKFVDDIAPKIESLRGGFNAAVLFEIFDDAVQAVESMKEIQGGKEKKACAIKMILAVYDKYKLDLVPGVPSMLEKQALEMFLNVAIDGIVAILNKRGVFVHGAGNEGQQP